MDQEPASNYSRGRGGRPYERAKATLKREGDHVCWLCTKPIDMTLHHLHAEAWTLDHADPLSTDTSDRALDPSNHREAHRSCNSAKGNRPHAPATNNSRSW